MIKVVPERPPFSLELWWTPFCFSYEIVSNWKLFSYFIWISEGLIFFHFKYKNLVLEIIRLLKKVGGVRKIINWRLVRVAGPGRNRRVGEAAPLPPIPLSLLAFCPTRLLSSCFIISFLQVSRYCILAFNTQSHVVQAVQVVLSDDSCLYNSVFGGYIVI